MRFDISPILVGYTLLLLRRRRCYDGTSLDLHYGNYRSAPCGVDEDLSKLDKKRLFQRVEYSCRLAIKPTA
jgi:hypothetical protein